MRNQLLPLDKFARDNIRAVEPSSICKRCTKIIKARKRNIQGTCHFQGNRRING